MIQEVSAREETIVWREVRRRVGLPWDARSHRLGGWTLSAQPDDSPCFISGRGARVLAQRAGQLIDLGSMGELHPEVLESYKLIHPAAVFELDLAQLAARV